MKIPMKVTASIDITLLVYLSVLYKLDFTHLIFLYEKIGKDIFYIFYLFSGQKFNFPRSEKLNNLSEDCRRVLATVKRGEKNIKFSSKKEHRLYEFLQKIYNSDEASFLFELEL